MTTHPKNYGIDNSVLPEGNTPIEDQLAELVKLMAPSLYGQYPPIKNASEILPLAEVEKMYILKVLSICKNKNKTMAAAILGIGRATLYRKLREYGVL